MLIDVAMVPTILAAAVHTNNRGYAYVCPTSVHRLVIRATRGTEVDHINGDKLDNRLANLRLVTRSQNCRHRTKLNSNNTSGATGVYWRARIHSWQAMIWMDGKLRSLGYFKDKDVAIAKRQAAERERDGITSSRAAG